MSYFDMSSWDGEGIEDYDDDLQFDLYQEVYRAPYNVFCAGCSRCTPLEKMKELAK